MTACARAPLSLSDEEAMAHSLGCIGQMVVHQASGGSHRAQGAKASEQCGELFWNGLYNCIHMLEYLFGQLQGSLAGFA